MADVEGLTLKGQIERVDKEILEHDLKMDTVRSRLEKTSAELAQLRFRRTELATLRGRLAAQTSPILQLPYEILSKIFVAGTEGQEEPEYYIHSAPPDNTEDLEFPTRVSHVNRHFRHVALTTASLWTYITMKEQPPYERTTLWMERAKGCPLEINIDFSDELELSLMHHDVTLAFQTIQPPSRWRSFCLRVESYEVVHEAMMAFRTPAPLLQELILVHTRSLYDEDEFEPENLVDAVDIFVGIAPRLRCVHLYAVHLLWRRTMLHGLQELELSYHSNNVRPDMEDWLQILQLSPGLKRLAVMASGPRTLRSTSGGEVVPFSSTTVALHALQELELGDIPPAVVRHILSSFYTPLLRILCLESLEIWEDLPSAAGLELLTQSRYPALKQLKIVLCPLDAKAFLALLERLPNLEVLELHGSDELLEVLLADDGDPARGNQLLLPKLRALKATGYTGSLLTAFVEQRCRIGGYLNKLLVDRDSAMLIAPDHQNQLRRFVTFGFFEGSERDESETGSITTMSMSDDEDEEDEDEDEDEDVDVEEIEDEEDEYGYSDYGEGSDW